MQPIEFIFSGFFFKVTNNVYLQKNDATLNRSAPPPKKKPMEFCSHQYSKILCSVLYLTTQLQLKKIITPGGLRSTINYLCMREVFGESFLLWRKTKLLFAPIPPRGLHPLTHGHLQDFKESPFPQTHTYNYAASKLEKKKKPNLVKLC